MTIPHGHVLNVTNWKKSMLMPGQQHQTIFKSKNAIRNRSAVSTSKASARKPPR
jgi:hypothetical protein